MMVVPFCVLLAWTMGQPLDLDFNAFEAMVLFGCVLLAVLVLQVGAGGMRAAGCAAAQLLGCV